jgi:tRNA-splicing ligase RtcB
MSDEPGKLETRQARNRAERRARRDALARGHEIFAGRSGVGTVKAWTLGVPFEQAARRQLENVASLPFIHGHVAAMPDVHFGKGASVGTVIPTAGAIIPAAVGVDIGCGMLAQRTSLGAAQLPDSLAALRAEIERAVPHGGRGGKGRDPGAWQGLPKPVARAWRELERRYQAIVADHPRAVHRSPAEQLGTLGGGNHFIEVCLDEDDRLWVMLHSGSRGPGNRIGTTFIELAKRDMRRHQVRLPDADLAYFEEGADFDAYLRAVEWAQEYAHRNRELMLQRTLLAMRRVLPPFQADPLRAIDCHHNYVARETHFGHDVFVTRKGAVRAREGDLGIIPGSMGARSFIVRGLGNPASFESCSHGAGRSMSRTQARKRFSVEDHERATAGVECRKDVAVLDETPGAYKSIDAVMQAQGDLVEIVHTLRQVVCVKG